MTAVEPQFRDLDIPQFTFLNNNNTKKSSNLNDHFSYKSQNGNYSRCNSNKPVFNMSNTNNSRQNNKTQFCFDQFASNLNAKKQIDNSNWICYASTASESDGGSHVSSELTGFKIVQSGSVVHDETEDDFDSMSESKSSSKSDESGVKFASSLMVIGPDCKEISLPSFA